MTYVEVDVDGKMYRGNVAIPGIERLFMLDDDAHCDFDENTLEDGDIVILVKKFE